jgi:glycosyltransferase involved in cell wall biosynthesis
MVSICAVITARNEAQYLRILLPLLASQGIDAVIIDNESTDGSNELYSEFRGNPLIHVERLPYRGYYSLYELLDARQKIYDQIKYDWVVHQDADEVLEHFEPGRTLRDAVQDADQSGYNILNFDEFVFLPEPNADYSSKNFHTEMLRYYFFEPSQNRLNRAWKRSLGFRNISFGGHRLSGDQQSIFPHNLVLRHYIVLSYEYAKRKYLNRIYGKQEINRGWHGNKLNFTEDNLRIPQSSKFLFELDSYSSRKFRKDVSASKHYWEWEK